MVNRILASETRKHTLALTGSSHTRANANTLHDNFSFVFNLAIKVVAFPSYIAHHRDAEATDDGENVFQLKCAANTRQMNPNGSNEFVCVSVKQKPDDENEVWNIFRGEIRPGVSNRLGEIIMNSVFIRFVDSICGS